MSYTFETKIEWIDDFLNSFVCTFVITYADGTAMELHYSGPTMFSKTNDWNELIENLWTPDYKKRLMFCASNGRVILTVQNGCLSFHCSKNGAGGDGSFTIFIKPTPQVQDELKKVLDALTLYNTRLRDNANKTE